MQLLDTNIFSHWSHLTVLSPCCFHSWWSLALFEAKTTGHWEQIYSFPVWSSSMCCWSLSSVEYFPILHSLHWNFGFTFSCTNRMCCFKAGFEGYSLAQRSQTKDSLLECLIMWPFRLAVFSQTWEHSLHVDGPVWTFMLWFFRDNLSWNSSLHGEHWNRTSISGCRSRLSLWTLKIWDLRYPLANAFSQKGHFSELGFLFQCADLTCCLRWSRFVKHSSHFLQG